MKFSILFVALVFVIASSPASSADVDPNKVKNFLELLKNNQAHLRQVLHEIRSKVDKSLIEYFPHLKPKIEKFHAATHECYDQTIANNQTVNIFKAKVRHVIEEFFKNNGHLLHDHSVDEIRKRVKIFIKNLAVLAELLVQCVIKKSRGEPTSKYGLTSMALYTREEFEQSLNKQLSHSPGLKSSAGNIRLRAGGIIGPDPEFCNKARRPNEIGMEIPANFSWKDQGFTSPVGHQIICGACYVFATTHALESQYMIANNKPNQPELFSVQSTLNCMSGGCDGGSLQEPIQYFIKKGVTRNESCPYIDRMGTCTDYPIAFKADKYCYYNHLTDEEMQLMLMRYGPAGVAIDATAPELTWLKDAPYTDHCDVKVDHAVLLVGWDEKNWIIKNSWSDTWGIEGYLYLPRGQNKCGVNTMYGVPIVNRVVSSETQSPVVPSQTELPVAEPVAPQA